MDAIEKAVRNALEKGDAEDKNFRRRVYVSARHALEKSMQGKRLTQALADEKFSRLSEVAAGIESEFSVAEEADDYLPQGRRSYEAAAPQVDGAAEEEAAELEEAVIAEAAPESESQRQPEAVEEAVTFAHPDPDARAAELEAIGAELTPQAFVEPEKPKKPHSRRKSAKNIAVEEAPVVIDAPAAGEDLFDKSEPDWKEVSLPATYDAEPERASEPAAAEELGQKEFGAPITETVPAPVLPADEPEDFSEQDIDDLRALDEARSEGADPFATNRAESEISGAGPSEPDDGPTYEVRPAAAAEAEAAAPAEVRQRTELRRGWAFLFILITLLAFFVMALWIAFTTGALKIRSAADAPAVETVAVAPADEPQPAAEKPAAPPVSDDWLMIFRPDNPGDLVVDPTIKADITGQGPLARLRIEPASTTTGDAAVVFAIGEGILQQLAGKKAVFDIVAAADKGKPTQISVMCDFAGLGDCGRKRYQIDDATSDNLFQIEFPAGAPQGAGEFILNPDVDGKGRALIIYAIKVRVAN